MTVNLDVDKLSAYASSVREEYETELKRLVDIPSVSMDPTRKEDMTRCADACAALLRRLGAEAEVIKTRGNPVVVGHFKSNPSHPTVAVYNHMDVQPADPAEWNSQPFLMTIEDGVYRGRGTTDDKGPALAALYAASYAHKNQLPINIKFIWELEEEIGSPSFERFLQDNLEKVKTDSVVISDTIWVSRERPAIPYGLRGLQGVIVKLATGKKDVHSGLTGGLARNPIGELCQLISECYDARTGQVHIKGFYDDVRAASQDEIDNFVKSGFTLDGFKNAHELLSLRTADAADGAQRIWAKPTFEVHGITGGYNGPGVKTIVPHAAEAKISMRLVPDQNPDKIIDAFTRFVKERCPDATVIREGTLRPFIGEFKGRYADAAIEAMKYAFGKEPAFTREGGSIGAVVSMKDHLHVPVVFLGLSLPEHGYHAINENFDWHQAGGGIQMFIKYFHLLTRMNS
jgi:acetylornithine deacetylase/succinyl-diaminopimelate desuccinylase-like protein